MSARAATPRRGDGATCCASVKCIAWSKDARAVRPYRVRGRFVAREAFVDAGGHAKARSYQWCNVLCVRKMYRLVEGRTGRASLQTMCSFADAHVCVCWRGEVYFIVSWRRKVVPRPGVEVLT
jgi:hypothetical protein